MTNQFVHLDRMGFDQCSFCSMSLADHTEKMLCPDGDDSKKMSYIEWNQWCESLSSTTLIQVIRGIVADIREIGTRLVDDNTISRYVRMQKMGHVTLLNLFNRGLFDSLDLDYMEVAVIYL